MHRDVLVEDVQRLLGGREFDRQHAFAVVHGLGRALAQLRALSIGSAVLVEQRVVAVVREAKAVILSAVPAVMEAVAVAVNALDGVDAAFGNGTLLAHLVLGVCRWLQGLHDAQADLVLGLLARCGAMRAIGDGRRQLLLLLLVVVVLEAGRQCHGDGGVWYGVVRV